jgi:hypothetical protein
LLDGIDKNCKESFKKLDKVHGYSKYVFQYVNTHYQENLPKAADIVELHEASNTDIGIPGTDTISVQESPTSSPAKANIVPSSTTSTAVPIPTIVPMPTPAPAFIQRPRKMGLKRNIFGISGAAMQRSLYRALNDQEINLFGKEVIFKLIVGLQRQP